MEAQSWQLVKLRVGYVSRVGNGFCEFDGLPDALMSTPLQPLLGGELGGEVGFLFRVEIRPAG